MRRITLKKTRHRACTTPLTRFFRGRREGFSFDQDAARATYDYSAGFVLCCLPSSLDLSVYYTAHGTRHPPTASPILHTLLHRDIGSAHPTQEAHRTTPDHVIISHCLRTVRVLANNCSRPQSHQGNFTLTSWDLPIFPAPTVSSRAPPRAIETPPAVKLGATHDGVSYLVRGSRQPSEGGV